uniref:Uncharacterized protein n=1 Tax=Anguilla anguilla TaxID=7936 RepID=A0A0E9WMI4_ANGAN
MRSIRIHQLNNQPSADKHGAQSSLNQNQKTKNLVKHSVHYTQPTVVIPQIQFGDLMNVLSPLPLAGSHSIRTTFLLVKSRLYMISMSNLCEQPIHNIFTGQTTMWTCAHLTSAINNRLTKTFHQHSNSTHRTKRPTCLQLPNYCT